MQNANHRAKPQQDYGLRGGGWKRQLRVLASGGVLAHEKCYSRDHANKRDHGVDIGPGDFTSNV